MSSLEEAAVTACALQEEDEEDEPVRPRSMRGLSLAYNAEEAAQQDALLSDPQDATQHSPPLLPADLDRGGALSRTPHVRRLPMAAAAVAAALVLVGVSAYAFAPPRVPTAAPRAGTSQRAGFALLGLLEAHVGNAPQVGHAARGLADEDAPASTAHALAEQKFDNLVDKLSTLHQNLDGIDRMARLMEAGYHLKGIIYCDLNATWCGNDATGIGICCNEDAICCGPNPDAQVCCGAGNTCCPNGICVAKPKDCKATNPNTDVTIHERLLEQNATK